MKGNKQRRMRTSCGYSKPSIGVFFVFAAIFLILSGDARAGAPKPPAPAPRDKCPVCGMFVAKYKDFIAEIVFQDGYVAFFDGVKDLYKYYFNMKKYNPGKTTRHIVAVYVTDYYRVALVDGYRAYYVVGSNVYGPMGKELIPFEKKEDAEDFMKDHLGKAVLRFTDVMPSIVRGLD